MKTILFSVIGLVAITLASCGNNSSKDTKEQNATQVNTDTSSQTTNVVDSNIKAVAVTFSNVDPKVAASIKEITDHYLHIKNALAGDNADEAAKGGEAMVAAMNKVDKSAFTAEQKKVYDDNEEDLKEHAEHIGKSKIDHQREHFAMISEDVYALAKAFGAGRPVYHDFCPMYDNNKGAYWLSETAEIKNPYMGAKMPKCGEVKEKIQQAKKDPD